MVLIFISIIFFVCLVFVVYVLRQGKNQDSAQLQTERDMLRGRVDELQREVETLRHELLQKTEEIAVLRNQKS
ncbi:MAG: hypothetical protein MJ069_01640 [Salinivirgaceae bacterium]|nr:hypothetical protein [Salinivirgaceae bacterium]